MTTSLVVTSPRRACIAALALVPLGGMPATAQSANLTPENVAVFNLLSPFFTLNATAVGQQTLRVNLAQSVAINQNVASAAQLNGFLSTPTLAAMAISDENLLGKASNAVSGLSSGYGTAANLAGGLPVQNTTAWAQYAGSQPIGGFGSILGAAYVAGVGSNGTTVTLPKTIQLLTANLNLTGNTAAGGDSALAKFYFANGTVDGTTPAVAPAGTTLATANGLPNKTTSVYDTAYGVSNTQAGQNAFGNSHPYQTASLTLYDTTVQTKSAAPGAPTPSTNSAFPSSHMAYAESDAILLGMMVPQLYQSMLMRASQMGDSRIVIGVHYPTDVIASRGYIGFELSNLLGNPVYINNASVTGTAVNLPALLAAATPELQAQLGNAAAAAGCGTSLASCATSAANVDPYAPSATNAGIYAARQNYGLPTIAGAPAERSDTAGNDASILLTTLYGGDSAAAKALKAQLGIAGGLDGNLATSTIDQIIGSTETDPLTAFYGTQLSYWTRINLYAAAGYFNGITGTLSLQSTDTVTQNVVIAPGGTLDANGTVAGTVVVSRGGTLTGSGAVGALTASAGSIVAPGSLVAQAALLGGASNVAGTRLAVNGSVSFDPASTFAVTASPTQVTSLAATGAAALNGAAVALALPTGAGSFPGPQRSALLTAAGGVTGTFSGVTTNLLFATPTLSYDANDAYLTMGGSNFRVAAATRNQYAVATALSNGALANPNAAVLVGLETLQTEQNAAGSAALGSLSGSGITATQNLAHRSTQQFVSSISDQLTFFAASPGNVNSVTFTDEFAARAQGFAPVRELADLPASHDAPAVLVERPRSFRVWATGFGGAENISGNAGIGFGAENNTIVGGSAGLDYQFMPGALVGIAAGGTSGNFNVPNFATAGSTTGGHVAGYGLANYGPNYGASSITGSFFSNKTTRSVAAAGLGETDNGSFASREVRLRIEAGRRFAAATVPGLGRLLGPAGSITPFVALEIADLHASAFSEYNRSGPTLLGLTIASQDTADVPAFVGARFERVTQLGNGMVFTPALQVAYVHDFAPQRSQLGSFAGLPQAVFLVDGARPAYNSAQVKAGAELAFTPNAALFANFDGEFSGLSRFYGGKGGFRYAF